MMRKLSGATEPAAVAITAVTSPAIAAEIMKINYPNKKISAISPSALEKYPSAEPVKFREVILSAGVHLALVKVGERYPSRIMVLLFHASVPLTKMLSRARMLAADLESISP